MVPENKLVEKGIDHPEYNSKLIVFFNYHVDLLKTDNDARVIIYLKEQKDAELILNTFKRLQISHVAVSGTAEERHQAITSFRSGRIRTIIINSEDGTVGLDLPEASHIIIMNHFKEKDWEMAGISRALRICRQNPLKVVRLVAMGTVEEDIVLQY